MECFDSNKDYMRTSAYSPADLLVISAATSYEVCARDLASSIVEARVFRPNLRERRSNRSNCFKPVSSGTLNALSCNTERRALTIWTALINKSYPQTVHIIVFMSNGGLGTGDKNTGLLSLSVDCSAHTDVVQLKSPLLDLSVERALGERSRANMSWSVLISWAGIVLPVPRILRRTFACELKAIVIISSSGLNFPSQFFWKIG